MRDLTPEERSDMQARCDALLRDMRRDVAALIERGHAFRELADLEDAARALRRDPDDREAALRLLGLGMGVFGGTLPDLPSGKPFPLPRGLEGSPDLPMPPE